MSNQFNIREYLKSLVENVNKPQLNPFQKSALESLKQSNIDFSLIRSLIINNDFFDNIPNGTNIQNKLLSLDPDEFQKIDISSIDLGKDWENKEKPIIPKSIDLGKGWGNNDKSNLEESIDLGDDWEI